MHTTWHIPFFQSFSPLLLLLLLLLLLFLLAALPLSPSLSLSSGSVVCFQEIRPLLISHMSRVELGKAVCVCIPVFVCEFAHICIHRRLEKKRASTDFDYKFSPLAASFLQLSEELIRRSCKTVWPNGTGQISCHHFPNETYQLKSSKCCLGET